MEIDLELGWILVFPVLRSISFCKTFLKSWLYKLLSEEGKFDHLTLRLVQDDAMKIFLAFVLICAVVKARPDDPEIAVRAPSTFQNCDCQCDSYTWTSKGRILGNCVRLEFPWLINSSRQPLFLEPSRFVGR